MRRREFIAGLGSAVAATWAPAARAQVDRVRSVAALALATSTTLARMAALREELQKVGWRDGRNLRLDVRIADDAATLRVASEEVVKSAPEVIFALTGPVMRVIKAHTRTIPGQGGEEIAIGLESARTYRPKRRDFSLDECLFLAHRDGRRSNGQPSLSGHCGHGRFSTPNDL